MQIAILRGLSVNTFPDLVSAQQYRWEFTSGEALHKFPPKQPRSQFIHTTESINKIPEWVRNISFQPPVFCLSLFWR